jgi:hypothetical protein
VDAYINISVSMPDAEPFSYRMKVKNVYGVMRRADDPKKKFVGILAGALARNFGDHAVTIESLASPKPVSVLQEPDGRRGPGRPRKGA